MTVVAAACVTRQLLLLAPCRYNIIPAKHPNSRNFDYYNAVFGDAHMSICTLLIFLSNASCCVDLSDAKLRLPADRLRSTVDRAYTDALADVRSDWLRSTVARAHAFTD